MKNKFLDKAALLGVLQLKKEFVPLDGGKGVTVTQMSAPDFLDMWEKLPKDEEDRIKNIELNVTLLSYCVVDEEGNRMLTDESDVEALRKSNPKAFNKLMNAARKLNGLDGEIEKNSEASTGEGSPSGSPQD